LTTKNKEKHEKENAQDHILISTPLFSIPAPHFRKQDQLVELALEAAYAG